MITFKQDIKNIKKLLLNNDIDEIRRLNQIFTIDYRTRIMENLNPFEVKEWVRINGTTERIYYDI